MKIQKLHIRNFKSIRELTIDHIEQALILVGQNNTGKTVVLDAIRTVFANYQITPEDFGEDFSNIEIFVTLSLTKEDLLLLHQMGLISKYKRYDAWKDDFRKKLPSYQDGSLAFEFIANRDGRIRYSDGVNKHNRYVTELFPKILYVDAQRNLSQLQNELLMLQEDVLLKRMRTNCCMFNQAKECSHCFSCIGLINQKTPEKLNAFEAMRLLDYKLYQISLDSFTRKVNKNFHKNGGKEDILYTMNRDLDSMMNVSTKVSHQDQLLTRSIDKMGKGMRSVYILSLLETYAEGADTISSIIMVEEPEIFLHPKMQKVSGEILYRLSKKNQVIFTTHSPNLLANFNSRQIRQIVLDEDGYSLVREKTDLNSILDDLGYTASDLMNVNFVFIVEGKQDKSRLPQLIRKFYSEVCDESGNLYRISIITTNSCTNIKTYANLKYMNQIYLKDQFLMIRDGDGKDRLELQKKLCRYYEEQNERDVDKLPRVTAKNVLVLKYYSFENYFLNPRIMTQIGVLESVSSFYEIFLSKWKEYLSKLKSSRHLVEVIGHDLESVEDIMEHMEDIKIYVRGHNIFDLYYGRFRSQENELLERYLEAAPREEFQDILDSIDQFIFFENRLKE